MFTQIPVYILCAMPSNQVCQCLRQFGMPFFQLYRCRTETLQRSLTQMQGIGFRRFFRFRDQPDRNRAYRSVKPCQLRQYRRCNHFQARCRHIVCRQKDKPAVFDTCRLKMRVQVGRQQFFHGGIQPPPLSRLFQKSGKQRVPPAQLFQIHKTYTQKD